jgi:hypothetical protein
VAGVTFNINPPNSGQITCNNKVITNLHFYIGAGTQCIAEPNKGFQFSSWIEQLRLKSSRTINASTVSRNPLIDSFLGIFGIHQKDNAANFTVTQFGNFTANLKEIPPPIPPEYLLTLFGIMLGTFITSLFRWVNGWLVLVIFLLFILFLKSCYIIMV